MKTRQGATKDPPVKAKHSPAKSPPKVKKEPGVLIGTIDMAQLESVREKYPYLRDRNQHMYAEFAKKP